MQLNGKNIKNVKKKKNKQYYEITQKIYVYSKNLNYQLYCTIIYTIQVKKYAIELVNTSCNSKVYQ